MINISHFPKGNKSSNLPCICAAPSRAGHYITGTKWLLALHHGHTVHVPGAISHQQGCSAKVILKGPLCFCQDVSSGGLGERQLPGTCKQDEGMPEIGKAPEYLVF